MTTGDEWTGHGPPTSDAPVLQVVVDVEGIVGTAVVLVVGAALVVLDVAATVASS